MDAVILAWSLIFLLASMSNPLPWSRFQGQNTTDPASTFFYDTIQQRGSTEDLHVSPALFKSNL